MRMITASSLLASNYSRFAMGRTPVFVIVACPENRRVALFQAALKRLGIPAAQVIPWLDILTGRASLNHLTDPNTVVRVESPGENFLVEREMIALGAEASEETDGGGYISPDLARRLTFDRGRILYPRQWFLGFQAILNRIAKQLALESDGLQPLVMNDPHEIALMFDKARTHQLLADAGVKTPEALGEIRSYDHLLQAMARRHWRRVFVKLRYGSSSSGIVAYETNGWFEQAWTSAELCHDASQKRLYNSLRVRRYRDARDIAAIIDAVCDEGAHVENWIPKAGFDGAAADLRVVVIGQQPAHTVVRLSQSPMTNLHLGNRRGDSEEYFRFVGEKVRLEVEGVCRQTAALFPRSLYAGLDVGVDCRSRRAVVFEVNAFGDLLPAVLHNGLDTYELEIRTALGRFMGKVRATVQPCAI
jgi:glutathione synthase/RimK-type ligase-like ATP-grasp enzyme